jgi:hypothetical protein
MGAGTSQHEKEGDTAPFSLTVLSYGDARIALLDAELKDHYREACYADKLNNIARTGHSYVAAKQSDADRAHLQQHITGLIAHLPTQLKTLGSVEIVTLLPSADGGLPHTRPTRVICLPMSPSPVSLETLTHELWHIHQRVHTGRWAHFLREAWGFEPYTGSLPDKFTGMARYNPDTLAHPLWIWNRTWVPVCLFTNPTTPTLKDTAVWFYNAQKGLYVTQPPTEMGAFFGTTLPAVAYEHPYELAAYLLASGRPAPCKAYEIAKQNFLTP